MGWGLLKGTVALGFSLPSTQHRVGTPVGPEVREECEGPWTQVLREGPGALCCLLTICKETRPCHRTVEAGRSSLSLSHWLPHPSTSNLGISPAQDARSLCAPGQDWP